MIADESSSVTHSQKIVSQPDLMPYYPAEKAVKRGIDLEWGKKQITKQVTTGILQGESTGKIAARLQKNIANMELSSALRAARTAITGAQNTGRQDSYEAAQAMGIKLKKEWLATLDDRTRDSHAELDGVQVNTDEKFPNGLMFPGDPEGDPGEVYNCRCTMIAAVDGVDTSDALRRDKYGIVSDMTYAQWEASKRGAEAKPISEIRTNELQEWRKSFQNKENLDILKSKIDSGEISTKLRQQMYKKHVEGTSQFEQYKASRLTKGQTPQSILTISEQESQNLINTYSCTGTVQITKSGKSSVKIVEYCGTVKVVGKYFDDDSYQETKRIGIYYAKSGTHIVPVSEEYHD